MQLMTFNYLKVLCVINDMYPFYLNIHDECWTNNNYSSYLFIFIPGILIKIVFLLLPTSCDEGEKAVKIAVIDDWHYVAHDILPFLRFKWLFKVL